MTEPKQIILSAYRLFIAVKGNVSLFLQRYREMATKHLGIPIEQPTPWVRVRLFAVMTWGAGADMQPVRPEYWERAEALMVQCNVLGIGVDLDLEDGNSLDQPRQIDDHWFITKVLAPNPQYQKLSKKLRIGGLSEVEKAIFNKMALDFYDMTKWTEALKLERKTYMARWINLLNKHNIDWRICIINEPPWTLNTFGSFYYWHYDTLTKDLKVANEKIIATTSLGYLKEGRRVPCGILAPHDVWQPNQVLTPLPDETTKKFKILWSEDGKWSDGRHPFHTLEEVRRLGTAVHDSIGIGIEIKCNEEVGAGPKMDVDLMDWSLVEAFAQAINPAPEPPHPEPIYVSIKVCTETYARANSWCPATAMVEFEAGKEPVESCQLHKPPCSYWFKKFDFRRWICCLFGRK